VSWTTIQSASVLATATHPCPSACVTAVVLHTWHAVATGVWTPVSTLPAQMMLLVLWRSTDLSANSVPQDLSLIQNMDVSKVKSKLKRGFNPVYVLKTFNNM